MSLRSRCSRPPATAQRRGRLSQHHLRPVLERFRQMQGADLLTPRQIRDRARQLQHPVIASRREVHLSHGSADQPFSGFIQFAKLPDLPHPHISIRKNIRRFDLRESLSLSASRSFNTRTDRFGRLAHPVTAQLLVIHARDFDVYINAIEQRT